MAIRDGAFCPLTVLDSRGDAYPCAKRPHQRGPCCALVPAGVVWGGRSEAGLHREPPEGWADETQPYVAPRVKPTAAQREEAKAKGYFGDPCGTCGALTLVQNGSCKKCTSCGSTDGCS